MSPDALFCVKLAASSGGRELSSSSRHGRARERARDREALRLPAAQLDRAVAEPRLEKHRKILHRSPTGRPPSRALPAARRLAFVSLSPPLSIVPELARVRTEGVSAPDREREDGDCMRRPFGAANVDRMIHSSNRTAHQNTVPMPISGSNLRSSRAIAVLLPQPRSPTSATVLPAEHRRGRAAASTLCSVRGSGVTSSKTTCRRRRRVHLERGLRVAVHRLDQALGVVEQIEDAFDGQHYLEELRRRG